LRFDARTLRSRLYRLGNGDSRGQALRARLSEVRNAATAVGSRKEVRRGADFTHRLRNSAKQSCGSGRASAMFTRGVLTRRVPRRSCSHRRTARPLSTGCIAPPRNRPPERRELASPIAPQTSRSCAEDRHTCERFLVSGGAPTRASVAGKETRVAVADGSRPLRAQPRGLPRSTRSSKQLPRLSEPPARPIAPLPPAQGGQTGPHKRP
jgi:hypothetical protein